ncbi:Uncharacterized protein dnm_094260 [Desulfonema magnum]|uniref:Uncharacterized protein n=1 Tax=Desulfonema magnum TaxID=45655 RepID=A0A975BYB1_9BACT|nr:Uncharacterized protein dnm_094260 [Desulfonema magnum]
MANLRNQNNSKNTPSLLIFFVLYEIIFKNITSCQIMA